MSDKPPPRFASAPPRPSGPPIPRDEPDDESPLRRAVRATPAIELPTPPAARVLGSPRRHDSGAKALAETPIPARARVAPSMVPPPYPSNPPPPVVYSPAPPPYNPAPPVYARAPAAPPYSPAPPPYHHAPHPPLSPPPAPPVEPAGACAATAVGPRVHVSSSPPQNTSSSPAPLRRLKKPWNDADWQKLWLAMQQTAWRSLAIVAGNPGMSTSPFEVATALADVGWQHLGKPITVIDARETTLGHVETRIADMAAKVAKNVRVIVVLSSTFDNPATLPLARAADGVILCVLLGLSKMGPAEQTVERIGRERFLGSVVLRDPPREKPV